MPTYVYETLPQNEGEVPIRFEVRQGMNDPKLTEQPGTGTPVRRLVNVATVVLEDGRQEIMTGLFTYGRVHMTSPIAEQLGCAFDQGPLGPFIRTDEGRQTTVPAVFAAGDAMRAASTVALSVADGAMAGVGAHRSLLFGVTPFAAPMMPVAASSAPAVTRE